MAGDVLAANRCSAPWSRRGRADRVRSAGGVRLAGGVPCWFAVVLDGDDVVGTAMRTAPFGAYPAYLMPMPDDAAVAAGRGRCTPGGRRWRRQRSAAARSRPSRGQGRPADRKVRRGLGAHAALRARRAGRAAAGGRASCAPAAGRHDLVPPGPRRSWPTPTSRPAASGGRRRTRRRRRRGAAGGGSGPAGYWSGSTPARPVTSPQRPRRRRASRDRPGLHAQGAARAAASRVRPCRRVARCSATEAQRAACSPTRPTRPRTIYQALGFRPVVDMANLPRGVTASVDSGGT